METRITPKKARKHLQKMMDGRDPLSRQYFSEKSGRLFLLEQEQIDSITDEDVFTATDCGHLQHGEYIFPVQVAAPKTIAQYQAKISAYMAQVQYE